jgi:lipoprotein-releasing system permease protein
MNEPAGTHPFAPFEWMLSLRYLRARRQEGFISVNAGFSFLGIMLGVATLIVVMAVMNGFRKELLDKILGLNGHVLIQPLESPLTDWEQVTQRVSGIDGVTLATPIVEGPALASFRSGGEGVLVRGIRAQDLGQLGSIAHDIRHGTLDGFDAGSGVAIGQRLADKLSVGVGDELTLLTPHGDRTVLGVLPRVKNYKVTAVFEIGMFEYDAAVVFMPLQESQAYFNNPARSPRSAFTSLTRIRLIASAGWSRALRGDRSRCSTGGSSTPRSSARFRSNATSCCHRDHDRDRGVVQHYIHPHHACEKQGTRHRHSAYDRRNQGAR